MPGKAGERGLRVRLCREKGGSALEEAGTKAMGNSDMVFGVMETSGQYGGHGAICKILGGGGSISHQLLFSGGAWSSGACG